jgi:hypothetical protein
MERTIRQIACDCCGKIGISNNHLTIIEMKISLVRQGWVCNELHDYCKDCQEKEENETKTND